MNLTLPKRDGVLRYEFGGAARLNDAYGTFMGTTGFGTVPMFSVENGGEYRSKAVRARKITIEESNRGLTRAIIDLDDFATPYNPAAGYIPSDDQTVFLRVLPILTSGVAVEGPIVCVPSYDFFTTKSPIFTVIAKAPNLGIGAFPAFYPDFLDPGVLNFMVPAYNATVSIKNLDAPGGFPIFVSFHPGSPPTILQPQDEISLTGVGAPEFFVAAGAGNPLFTVRIAVVNSA